MHVSTQTLTQGLRALTRPAAMAAVFICGIGLTQPMPASAQGMFSPAVVVNEQVITNYEIDQRRRLLQVFNTPGDLGSVAREQLIDERLKQSELARLGIAISDAALQRELEAFAARGDMSLDQFTAMLNQNGIDQAALRDFVSVGTAWRDYARQLYVSQINITDADIDRALAQSTAGASDGLEVLLTEIIIAAPPPQAAQAQAEAARISQIRSTDAFEAEARRVSALPSRDNGGRLDWLPITNFPAGLRLVFLGLAPGEVTAPIPIQNGIALFQLRGVREAAGGAVEASALDYAMFYLPGGQSAEGQQAAANLAARIDNCDDLYGAAQGLPADQLERLSQSPAEVPQDIALELARLDANEVSTALTRNDGQTLVFLMLCSRTAAGNADLSRDAIRNQLTAQELTRRADVLTAELRAAAVIRNP